MSLTEAATPNRRPPVSIRMVGEMWDHAPDDWTGGETALAACLAEFANDETRECFPGLDILMHRLKISDPKSLSRLLRGLAKKGYELRIPIGKNGKGKPVFAYEGKKTAYRLPNLCPDPPHHFPTCWAKIRAAIDAQKVANEPPSGSVDNSEWVADEPPTEPREGGGSAPRG